MFRFKEFTILQDKTAMKVGTDGVLIGAWANIDQGDRHALDIGCGTALIALMVAQRSKSVVVDGVEIDCSSAEQAQDNVNVSKWSDRVNIHNVDVCNFKQSFKYDLILCNPPFFNNSLLSPDAGRSAARHTITLTFSDLITAVERLLRSEGRFSMILPYDESKVFDKFAQGRLSLHRRCMVRGKVGADIKRVMSEYRLYPAVDIECSEMAIRESVGDEYTESYRHLTADFYLKF